jgi:hypothetical protein
VGERFTAAAGALVVTPPREPHHFGIQERSRREPYGSFFPVASTMASAPARG